MILRRLLAETHTAADFSELARNHFLGDLQTHVPPNQPLFTSGSKTQPLPAFNTLLCRARVLYGCGLGLEAVELFTRVISASVGLRWEEGDEMEDALSVVDCDLAAALYNVKDVFGTRLKDQQDRDVLVALDVGLKAVACQMEDCGGDNPFERAQDTLSEFKL